MLVSLLSLLAAADPAPVPSRIEGVTVYSSSAIVRRRASLPGTGDFVISGLPSTLDRQNVRVACRGGDVVGFELRERQLERAPAERVQVLRERLLAAQRELQGLEDEAAVLDAVRAHLTELSKVSTADQARDVREGRAPVEAWDASLQFLATRWAENARGLRASAWKIEDQTRAVRAIETELGQLQAGGAVPAIDVVVDVVAAGAAELELEYQVGGTGWRPVYDLRTARDLSKVELVYRAQVWQATGEDWSEVELELSTAQPQRGAQAPEPRPIRLAARSPDVPAETMRTANRAVRSLGYTGDDQAAAAAPTERPFASVEELGLSARFRLPRRETVESRDTPTSVLVGSAELAIEPERITVPALAATVWLRARARNTSEWTLLPGQAAVFLGGDYLGPATIATVLPGQELLLALGADPAVTVTRTKAEDQAKRPGFLSTRRSLVERWRIRLENHGAIGAKSDGSVDVIVREAAPKSKDDRIAVEISKAEPAPSNDERWKEEREELGIQTWIVRVPRGGGADVVLETTITHPDGLEVVRQ